FAAFCRKVTHGSRWSSQREPVALLRKPSGSGHFHKRDLCRLQTMPLRRASRFCNRRDFGCRFRSSVPWSRLKRQCPMETLKDKSAIVGIGHTEYSRDSGRSEMSLAVEAIRNAVADAGLTPSDIDGIAKFSMDNNDHVFLAANLGIPALRFFAEAPWGG